MGVLHSSPPDRLEASHGGRAMDDDNEKAVIEKMADKVNDAVANIINTASTAAMRAGARSRASRSDDQRASLHSGKRPTRRPCLVCRRRRSQRQSRLKKNRSVHSGPF